MVVSVFFNKIRGWFDAAALSSEFTIVSARGVKEASLLVVVFALSAYALIRSFTTKSYSKKCPLVYEVEYTWKSAFDVAVVPLYVDKFPNIVVIFVSEGMILNVFVSFAVKVVSVEVLLIVKIEVASSYKINEAAFKVILSVLGSSVYKFKVIKLSALTSPFP